MLVKNFDLVSCFSNTYEYYVMSRLVATNYTPEFWTFGEAKSLVDGLTFSFVL